MEERIDVRGQEERLFEEGDSGRAFAVGSAILKGLEASTRKRFPKYGKTREFVDYIREDDGFSFGGKIAYLTGEYAKRKVRDVGERAFQGTTDFLFGNSIGKKVRGTVYDYNAESLVDMATQDYLRGYSHVEFIPAKYGTKDLVETGKDGKVKKLLGKFRGRKAWIAQDIENALGTNYEPIREKVGMTKEQFNFIVQKYIELHENTEYLIKKAIFRRETSEDEHSRMESDIMKSLFKYKGMIDGAEDIYKVGMAINAARTDDFGRGVQKYLRGYALSAGQN